MDTFLTNTLAAAATFSQAILGETFTLSGSDYIGVAEETENLLPARGGGYEQIRTLTITATSDQFATAPGAGSRPKLVARGTTWTVTAIRPGPFHYHFTCVLSS